MKANWLRSRWKRFVDWWHDPVLWPARTACGVPDWPTVDETAARCNDFAQELACAREDLRLMRLQRDALTEENADLRKGQQPAGSPQKPMEVTLKFGEGSFQWPRRASIPHLIPAEKLLLETISAVDGLPGDTTDIVVELQKERERLADWVESNGKAAGLRTKSAADDCNSGSEVASTQ